MTPETIAEPDTFPQIERAFYSTKIAMHVARGVLDRKRKEMELAKIDYQCVGSDYYKLVKKHEDAAKVFTEALTILDHPKPQKQ